MICNISTYLFTPLHDLKALRKTLQRFCKEQQLKGTILLASEGINLFVAGPESGIEKLLTHLRAVPGLSELSPKVSWSQAPPFTRMLVKVKKEIIAFGVPEVKPHSYTSPRLAPIELKHWLDEGKEFVLLDTRNDYEVELGTFHKAQVLPLKTFREFPQAIANLPSELKSTPVVTFCTGGIRCEKAAPYMELAGFQDVYQLDGGILKYFEEVGGDHYQGDCFVFDHRVGLDPGLEETESLSCFACSATLTPKDQADPRYALGSSCPHCYRDPKEMMSVRLEQHQAELDRVASPLPGSVPSDNRRPLRVPGRLDGVLLAELLQTLFPHVPKREWDDVVQQQLLLTPDGSPATLDRQVRAGEEYQRVTLEEVEPEVSGQITLLYEDDALIVVNKPAPLPVHASGRFHRNTLRHLLNLVWQPESPRPCHRLDANTTGVLVCARSHHFAKRVQRQFAEGDVQKRYLAKVHGHFEQDEWQIDLSIIEPPDGTGLRDIASPGEGLPSLTRGRVLSRDEDGTSLVEVELITGRTHQIRVHLWYLGHPIVGDPAYLPNRVTGTHLALAVGEPPMHLHCWKVTLTHPQTGARTTFKQPPHWLTPSEIEAGDTRIETNELL